MTTGLHHRPARGVLLAVLAVFVLSLQDALVKWLTAEFAVLQILFVRSVVMALPVFAALYRRHGALGLYTRRPLGHLLRLALNLVAFVLFFFALSRLPLADTTALMLTAPLFMALLSGPLLGERPNGRIWFAILTGFAGVLLMVAPQGDGADPVGVGAVLIASVVYALWMIQTRHLASTELSETMVLYSALGIAAICALFMPAYWQTPADLDSALLLGSVGLLSAVGHTLLVTAYRYAPVYVIGPFDYTALVWAVLLGFLIWGDVPDATLLAGAALIVLCGLFLFRLQRNG